MSLSTFLNLSKITNLDPKGSVSINGQTVPVWKCRVANLEKMLVPSIDSGASFQGTAVLVDELGNVGLFILVAANPSSIGAGGIAAREVWLAEASLSFWQAELNSSDLATESTAILAPSAELKIAFRPLTGSNPQNLNTITPKDASGPCVSATLIDQSVMGWSEDLVKLLLRLVDVETRLDLGQVENANSVLSGGIISVPSPLIVSASASKFILQGNSLENTGPVSASLNERSLARLELLRNNTLRANYENSSGGLLDSNYVCSTLPFDASPSWSKNFTGSSSEVLSNNLLRINKAASANANYSRSNVLNLSLGATETVFFHQASMPEGSYFDIEINGGSGSVYDIARLWGRGSVAVVQLLSRYQQNGNKIFGVTINPQEPFWIRLGVSDGQSRLWVNGQFADQNIPLASSGANAFRFGFQDLTAPSAWAEIIKVTTLNNILLSPSFSDQQGPIIGHVCTSTSAASKSVGLQGIDLDYLLGSYKAGNFAFEGDFFNRKNEIGRIFFDASIYPPDDGLPCDFAQINRLTYRNLFGEIGTLWGAGDGVNTFNVPNAVGRFPIAANASYPAASLGGEAAVSLNTNQNGIHAHILADSGKYFVYYQIVASGFHSVLSLATAGGTQDIDISNNLGTQTSGTGAPHNNMPPYISIPMFIKWR